MPTASSPSLCPDNHTTYIPSSSLLEPSVFADTDWAANMWTCYSVSSSAIFLASALIKYKYTLQYATALGSTESKLHATYDAAKYSKY